MSAVATPQHLLALSLANEIRLASGQWRRKVARQSPSRGRLTLAATLERKTFAPEVGALRLSRFLTAASRVGPGKAAEICRDAGILRRDPRIRDLTLRERAALADVLRRRAGRLA